MFRDAQVTRSDTIVSGLKKPDDHLTSLATLRAAFADSISWTKASSVSRFAFEVQGVNDLDSNLHLSMHSHTFYEVGLVLEGGGELQLGKRRYPLVKGSLYLVEPEMVHCVFGVPMLTTFSFHVSPVQLSSGKFVGCLPGISKSGVVENQALVDMVFAWADANRGRRPEPVALSLFARYLAFEMLSFLTHSDQEPGLSLVERALREIDHRLPIKMDVKDLAKQLGVSERTLRRHFHDQLGKSVMEYVNERRLMLAERYLTLHLSVSEVAHKVGFDSPSQLTRLFQKAKGQSPKTWQQSVAPTRRRPRQAPIGISS